MDEENKKKAEQFVEGIKWLAEGGRNHARLLLPLIDDTVNLEEAMAWLDDIAEGRSI